MSKTATSTPPPPPYFPQRNSTPTLRHVSAPSSSAAHYGHHHKHSRRKTKHLPGSGSQGASPPGGKKSTEGLGLSFEEIPRPTVPEVKPIPRTPSVISTSSVQTSQSNDSFQTSQSHQSIDEQMSVAPSMSTSASPTASSSSISTPQSSIDGEGSLSVETDASMEIIPLVNSHSLSDGNQAPPPSVKLVPGTPTPPRASWVPNFGKVAKAMVSTGIVFGMGERKVKKEVTVNNVVTAVGAVEVPASTPLAAPSVIPASPPLSLPPGIAPPTSVGASLRPSLPPGVLTEREQLILAEHQRVHECARLCSQWPQSGYNMTKYGCPGYYQPQTWLNPAYVASTMQRQAELERELCAASATFFSCRRNQRTPSTSEDDSEPSVDSYESSPTASMTLSSDDALAAAAASGSLTASDQKTAADIKAAMASPLISLGTLANTSAVSLLLTSSPKSIKPARSLTELDMLTTSMLISKDDSAMDVDLTDSNDMVSLVDSSEDIVRDQRGSLKTATRPVRAQSCGAKRPLASLVEEEDKRRKVDEAMVVEEAVETGVIQPELAVRKMSLSTPNLPSSAASNPTAVFGHVVKTSSTHPIIISPFFPSELLPILTAHLVTPPPTGPFSSTPLMMGSTIDVPSLLLSYVPPISTRVGGYPSTTLVPSPTSASFKTQQLAGNVNGNIVGNLLLSSCPGKRLRMDGPVKGRGPVCRDLKTDLERIKSEGVGCLVCCLDDTELALLGVPWDTYREVAADLELDVIRLPMPDGFTPVSLTLFDSQVTLIATKYSMRGINVLIHCRGGVGRAGLTACAWAIKMGYVQPHPSLVVMEEAALRQSRSGENQKATQVTQPQPSPAISKWTSSVPASTSTGVPSELEHQIVMSIVERVIAMIRSRRGLKAIESFEQVEFLAGYTAWLRACTRAAI